MLKRNFFHAAFKQNTSVSSFSQIAVFNTGFVNAVTGLGVNSLNRYSKRFQLIEIPLINSLYCDDRSIEYPNMPGVKGSGSNHALLLSVTEAFREN